MPFNVIADTNSLDLVLPGLRKPEATLAKVLIHSTTLTKCLKKNLKAGMTRAFFVNN